MRKISQELTAASGKVSELLFTSHIAATLKHLDCCRGLTVARACLGTLRLVASREFEKSVREQLMR